MTDLLVCPRCGKDFELRDALGGPPTPSSEASQPSPCTKCKAPAGQEERRDGDRNCAACYGLEIDSGVLVCAGGHAFPIVGGVPRVLAERQLETADARSIRSSFSRQWEHFDYEAEDRTWGQTVEKRLDDFLRMVDHAPDELAGKLVLDAGCGNGVHSRAVNRFGCEVLAADISDAVEGAYSHFARQGNDRTHFVQADLMRPPFRPAAFDIVVCAGVLVATPDPRGTFEKVAQAVAPGGTMFVWLYWRERGVKYRIKTALRRVLSPLPLRVRRAVAHAFVPQAIARQYVRIRFGKSDEARLKWREHLLVQLDFFTPRYRWEHTPEDLYAWYRELGFIDAKMTEVVDAGFGVAARRPGLGDGVDVDAGAAQGPLAQSVRA